jgi:hypothetical protein
LVVVGGILTEMSASGSIHRLRRAPLSVVDFREARHRLFPTAFDRPKIQASDPIGAPAQSERPFSPNSSGTPTDVHCFGLCNLHEHNPSRHNAEHAATHATSCWPTPKEVGFLFTISGLSVFAMILPAGFVIDKVGRKWATVPSTGIPALAFLFIPFSETFFQLAIFVAFLGVSNGLSLGSLATSTYDVPRASATPASLATHD